MFFVSMLSFMYLKWFENVYRRHRFDGDCKQKRDPNFPISESTNETNETIAHNAQKEKNEKTTAKPSQAKSNQWNIIASSRAAYFQLRIFEEWMPRNGKEDTKIQWNSISFVCHKLLMLSFSLLKCIRVDETRKRFSRPKIPIPPAKRFSAKVLNPQRHNGVM